MMNNVKLFIQRVAHNQKFSLPFSFIFEAISALQVLHLILKTAFTIQLLDTFTFTGFARDATSYTAAAIQFDTLSDDQSLRIWFVMILYLIFFLLLFIFGVFIQVRKESKAAFRAMRVTSIACTLHSRLFFFPIQYFFLNLIQSYMACNINGAQPYYCQDIWIAFTIIACLLNTAIAVLIETFFYDINKFKNSYATKSNSFHQVVLFHKFVALIIYFLIPKGNYVSSLEAALNAILTLASFAMLYLKLPFYQTKLTRFRIMILGLTLSSSLILIMRACSLDEKLLEIPWMMTTMLFTKVSLIFFDRLMTSIMRGGIETPEKAIQYCILVKEYNFGHCCGRVYSKKVPYHVLMVNNSLANYKIKSKSSNKEEISKEHQHEVYRNIIETMNSILIKYPKSIPLLIFMSQIYLKKLGNVPQAIGLVKRAESLNTSFALKNSVKTLNTHLKQLYVRQHSVDPKTLEIMEYFSSRKAAEDIKDSIVAEIQKHYDLWFEIKSDRVDAKKVFDLAGEIHDLTRMIESKFNSYKPLLIKAVSNSLLMYRLYVESVWELTVDAKKIMKQFVAITNNVLLRNPLEVYSDQEAVIVVSLRKDRPGVIVDASGSAQTLFDLEKSKIIDRSLDVLISNSIGQSHMDLIRKFSRHLDHNINHSFTTYGKDSTGDIFKMDAKFQLYPDVEEEIKLMIILKRMSPSMPVLIINSEGTIIDCGTTIKGYNDNLVLGTTKFQTICPEFGRVNDAFNKVHHPAHKSRLKSRISKKNNSLAPYQHNSKSYTYNLSVDTKDLPSPDQSKRSIDEEEVDLDFGRAHDICDNYAMGSKLSVYNSYEECNVEYEAQIEPYILDDKVYKVVKITSSHEVREHAKLQRKEVESVIDDFPEDFPFEDEGKTVKASSPHLWKSPTMETGITGASGFKNLLSMNTKTITHQENDYPFMKLITPDTGAVTNTGTGANERRTSKILSSFLKLDEFTPVKRNEYKSSTTKTQVKKVPVIQNNSVSSYLTGTSHTFKMLRKVFTQRSTFTLTKKTLFLVIFTILAMLGMAVLFYELSRQSMKNYENNLVIINNANDRQEYAVQTWQYSVQYYLTLAGLLNSSTTASLQQTVLTQAQNMLGQNNILTQLLTGEIGVSRLESIYLPDVNLWEPCIAKTSSGGLVNTFLSTATLFSMAGDTIEIPKRCTELFGDDKVIYLMNNTINDYLISSERLIDETQEVLDSSVQTDRLNLEIIIIVLVLTICFLCGVLLVISVMILRSYNRLFRSLMRIEEKYILERMQHLKNIKNLLSQDIEAPNFGADTINMADDFKVKVKEVAKKGTAKKIYKKNSAFSTRDERYFTRGLKTFFIRYVGATFVFIGIPSVFFLVSLTDSISTFHILDKLDDKLSATTNLEYQSRVLVTNLYLSAVFQDQYIYIRDQPLSIQLTQNLLLMRQAHEQVLIEFVQDTQVVPDPISVQLLQNSVCNLLPDDTVLFDDSCQIATNGANDGLLAIDESFISTLSNYIQVYESNPQAANSSTVINGIYSDVEPLIVVLERGFQYLTDHVRDVSQGQIDDFFGRQVYLFVGIILSMFVSAGAIYILSIKRFWFVDMGRGRILKAIPYKIIAENKALEFYLSRDFSKNKFIVRR